MRTEAKTATKDPKQLRRHSKWQQKKTKKTKQKEAQKQAQKHSKALQDPTAHSSLMRKSITVTAH